MRYSQRCTSSDFKVLIKLSAKAIFYSVDDQLFVMGKDPKKKSTLNLKILKNELGELYSVRLAKEAFEIKRNPENALAMKAYMRNKFEFL